MDPAAPNRAVIDMEAPSRILVIRLTAIGDVILTLPAVAMLRRNFPAAEISFLTTKSNAPLLRGFRDVAQTLAIDRNALRGKNPVRAGTEILRLFRSLRAGKYSLVVDLQANGESGWLARLTGAPRRWAIIKKPSRRWAYTQIIAPPDLHPAAAGCALLAGCGLASQPVENEFHLPGDAADAAKKYFTENRLDPAKPTLLIQAITSATHKNWPVENYVAVACYWRERGVQVIFSGGSGDRAALSAAAKEGFCLALGEPLLVAAGLVRLASFVLGGDTGLIHLAVAMGKPVLMLIHYRGAASAIPFQHPESVLTAPKSESIAGIPVATVNAALAARLKF